jgi:hypothetical protein
MLSIYHTLAQTRGFLELVHDVSDQQKSYLMKTNPWNAAALPTHQILHWPTWFSSDSAYVIVMKPPLHI